MKALSRRVAALERTTAPTEYRTFFQCLDNDGLYVEAPKQIDYRFGLASADDGPTFTREQVDRISRGAQVIRVDYIIDWRDDEPAPAR